MGTVFRRLFNANMHLLPLPESYINSTLSTSGNGEIVKKVKLFEAAVFCTKGHGFPLHEIFLGVSLD